MSFNLGLKATIRLIIVLLLQKKPLTTISKIILMYSCAIDKQKACDRLDILQLFQKLSKRPIPIRIVRFLFHLYFDTDLCVSWNGVWEYCFHFCLAYLLTI